MSLENLQDINRVKENFTLVMEYYKAITAQLDNIKDEIKESWESVQYWDINCKLSSYKKLVPISMEVILERYPYETNKELYTVSLSKEAKSIITDESLFTEQEIKSVSFK